MQVKNIQMSEVRTSALNPRKTFDQDELVELANSIKANGLIQPITLRKIEKSKDEPCEFKYEIVCGERRFRACQLLGKTEIEAIVKDLDDRAAFAAMVIENLQRKDVDPMEEAAAFTKLREDGTYSVQQMADIVGKSTSYVLSRIQLNNIIPEFVTLMKNGPLVLTHLMDICKLTQEQQTVLFNECFTDECRAQWKYKFPNIPQLHEMIDTHVRNLLSKGCFSVDDDSFEGGACAKCPLNSKNMEGASGKDVTEPYCNSPKCFKQRCLVSVLREARSRQDKMEIIYQGTEEENKVIIEMSKNIGIIEMKSLGSRHYCMKPEEPNKESFSDEKAYEQRYENYKRVMQVFKSNIDDGLVKPVFEVSYNGHLSGIEKYVYSIPSGDTENIKDCRVAEVKGERITKIKGQMAIVGTQAEEMKTEKERALMEKADYSKNNGLLVGEERRIFAALILMKVSGEFRQSICVDKFHGDYTSDEAWEVIKKNLNGIKREFIRSILSEKSVMYSKDLSAMLDTIVKTSMKEQHQSIVEETTKWKEDKLEKLEGDLKDALA